MKSKALTYPCPHSSRWILIIASAIAFLFVFLPIECSFPIFIIVAGLFLGIFIILFDRPKEFHSIFFLFTAGFLVRITVSIFLYLVSGILGREGNFFIGDGCNYSLNGWLISQLWARNITVGMFDFLSRFATASGALSNYDFFNAGVYSITGYSPFSLFFINCLAGSLSIIFIFIIANRLFNEKVALFAGALYAFWPSFIIWSSQNLKDPITNLAMLSFSYFFIRLQDGFRFTAIVFLCFSSIALYYIQPVVLVPLALSGLVYFLLSFGIRKEIKLAFLIFAGILLFFTFEQIFVKYFNVNLLELISMERRGRAYGNLSYFSNFSSASPAGFLAYLPLGLFAVWFLPFPWQIFSLNQLLVVPEMLIWYLLFPFMVKGVYVVIRDRIKPSYLLIAILFIFGTFLAVYEGNLGTLYRHKMIVMGIGFIFASFGLRLNRYRKLL